MASDSTITISSVVTAIQSSQSPGPGNKKGPGARAEGRYTTFWGLAARAHSEPGHDT